MRWLVVLVAIALAPGLDLWAGRLLGPACFYGDSGGCGGDGGDGGVSVLVGAAVSGIPDDIIDDLDAEPLRDLLSRGGHRLNSDDEDLLGGSADGSIGAQPSETHAVGDFDNLDCKRGSKCFEQTYLSPVRVVPSLADVPAHLRDATPPPSGSGLGGAGHHGGGGGGGGGGDTGNPVCAHRVFVGECDSNPAGMVSSLIASH